MEFLSLQGELKAVGVSIFHDTQLQHDRTLRAFYAQGKTAGRGFGIKDLTLIRNTCCFADGNEALQGALVRLPMLQEETGGSRHHEDIGVGSTDVCTQIVLFTLIPAIGIVVVHEGHTVAGIRLVVAEHIVCQRTPVPAAKGRVDVVLHREIEGSTLNDAIYLRPVDPLGNY